MARVALIDYGAGNLASVRKGLRAAGAELLAVACPGDLAVASGVVVPGVGHFSATRAIDASWREAIAARVAAGTPLLGICLGMQWLFDRSDESPGLEGLGALGGVVSQMPATDGIKIPHVGWNSLQVTSPSRLLDGIPNGTQVYFTHSFAAPATGATAATCTHGVTFAAAVESDRVFGVQFHPEKSADAGLRILRNFIACCRNA